MLDNLEFGGRTIAILCLVLSACIFLVVLALLLDSRRDRQPTAKSAAPAPERANEATLLVPIANPTKGAVAAPPAAVAGPPASKDARSQAAIMQQQAAALGTEVRRLRSDISTLRQQSEAILKQNAQLSTLNTNLANQARAAAQRATTSESDLKVARKDIAEIREYVLHLGGAEGIKDIIDLR